MHSSEWARGHLNRETRVNISTAGVPSPNIRSVAHSEQSSGCKTYASMASHIQRVLDEGLPAFGVQELAFDLVGLKSVPDPRFAAPPTGSMANAVCII